MPDQPASSNLLFTLTDDLPKHTIAAMEKTLTRFSDDADLTSNGYVTVPLCGPARIDLLTGRYQHSHDVTGNEKVFLSYGDAGYQHTDLLSRAGAADYRKEFSGLVRLRGALKGGGTSGTRSFRLPKGYGTLADRAQPDIQGRQNAFRLEVGTNGEVRAVGLSNNVLLGLDGVVFAL